MPDELRFAALVLSDLHFGVDLLREAEIPPLQFPWWKYMPLVPDIRRYMETRCKAHDIAIVMQLPLYVKRLLRRLQREEDFKKQKFDFYLFLGDLSTYANGASFRFLRDYILNKTYAASGLTKISGLNIPEDKIVLIPGNHDKMLRKNLDLFARELAIPLGFAPAPKPGQSSFLSRRVDNTEFLFILVDASIYATTEEKIDLSALNHLAKGNICKHLEEEILEKLNTVKRGGQVDHAAIEDYSTSRRFLLVHYAVDDGAVLGPSTHMEEFVLPHSCAGLPNLITRLKADVHLVIHGHLHRPRVYNHDGVKVISATTATQKQGQNGFFLLKFYASGDVVTEHHKWAGNSFAADPTPDLNVRFSLPLKTRVVGA